MSTLQITDVRAVPGDSAFLIDDGTTAVLYDTGFGFTGSRVAQKIKAALGSRPLDWILLTHSHYDHVLGLPWVLRAYPQARVAAGEYAQSIFARPSALDAMRTLDVKAAAVCGMDAGEDLTRELRVDVAVRDGDVIHCGGMAFTAVALPGHTRCSFGFYLKEERLLLSTETLGVYFGENTWLPSYLAGFRMTLDSFRRARELEIAQVLLPHYGWICGSEAKHFLDRSEHASVRAAEAIGSILARGGTHEEAAAMMEATFYRENVRPTYPIDAFRLNTDIMIELIRREWLPERAAGTVDEPMEGI